MRRTFWVCILALALNFFYAPAQATTHADARECFDTALAKAKSGSTLAEMVAKYLNVESVAMAAARSTSYRNWEATPENIREKLRSYIRTEVADSTGFSDIDLTTVKIVGKGKPRGAAYELSGSFKSTNGIDTFSLFITTQTGRCQIIDATWNNVTLSRYIGNKIPK